MVELASAPLRQKSAGFRSTLPPRKNGRPHQVKIHTVYRPPEGFIVCRRCTSFIDLSEMVDGIAKCPEGHSFDLEREREEQEERQTGAVPPYSGLPPDKVGKLGEEIVRKLGDLGPHGVIVDQPGGYHGKLDFITSKAGGGEIKTTDKEAPTKVFHLCKPCYRLAKDAALREQKLKVAVMVLVVLDFRKLEATIYIRTDSRFKNWKLAMKDEPFRVVPFVLPPWAEAVIGGAERADELLAIGNTPPDDMPF